MGTGWIGDLNDVAVLPGIRLGICVSSGIEPPFGLD